MQDKVWNTEEKFFQINHGWKKEEQQLKQKLGLYWLYQIRRPKASKNSEKQGAWESSQLSKSNKLWECLEELTYGGDSPAYETLVGVKCLSLWKPGGIPEEEGEKGSWRSNFWGIVREWLIIPIIFW